MINADRTQITQLIHQALVNQLREFQDNNPDNNPDNNLVIPEPSQIQLDRTKDPKHGDFASNIAMVLAKQIKTQPRVLAEKIIAHINNKINQDKNSENIYKNIIKIELAGPGFINFYCSQESQYLIIPEIIKKSENYGRNNLGQNHLGQPQKIHIEYVSANPTGPLHVGHGRGAAFGSALADLLSFSGFDVTREYYVNDAGRQMDILATSTYLRYLELCGEKFIFPKNGYLGGYIKDISAGLFQEYKNKFSQPAEKLFENIFPDLSEQNGIMTGDKEKHIDDLISNSKKLLGEKNYQIFHQRALNIVLEDIRDDLEQFRVIYQNWFSEKSLYQEALEGIERLKKLDLTYEKDGAVWFKATQFNDDKDRVLIRDNGVTTYFASDLAYLLNKLVLRKFDKAIYVLGADHHGYIPRLKGLCQAFGLDPERIDIPLVQFATLFRSGQPVQMSTRSGEFVTLRDLYGEVGIDAARYFYLMRKNEQHLDFDLDLAKSQSSDNPVYYIQYAHARICSVFRQLGSKNYIFDQENLNLGLENLSCLNSAQELSLIKQLSLFPETIQNAAKHYEPHQVTYYLRELAHEFHSYYNSQPFIIPDDQRRNAILALASAVKIVLTNGLKLLGLTAPDAM